MTMRACLSALSAILLLAPAVAAGAPIFDPVAEFSVTNGNPNGVWSYGEAPGATGAFTPLPTPMPSDTFPRWLNSADPYPANYPLVGRNVTDQPLDLGAGQFLPNDVFYLHPGCQPSTTATCGTGDAWAILRFTAPADGAYDFAGSFAGLTVSTTAVAVTLDGVVLDVLSGNDQIDGTESQAFSFLLDLLAGAAVDFRVGGRADIFGDSTLLDLKVTQVPEPSTSLLVVGGIASLAAVRRRSLRARGTARGQG